jgi:hypothetical protein
MQLFCFGRHAVVLLSLVLFLGMSLPVVADHHGSVRIYKLNSKKQLFKQRWTKTSHPAGCHDLRGTRKVHRFAQVNFAWCAAYSSDTCEAGTELEAMWQGGKYRAADIDVSKPQIRLLPGSKWYFDPEKNIRIRSWRCEY